MITAPISANNVTDVPVDMKCLTVDCQTLPKVIQVLIDEICDLKVDYRALDYGECVESATDLMDVLQNIINAIPCDSDSTPITEANDLLLTGLTTCSSDGWSCDEADACFEFANSCDPGIITVEVVTQALIDRGVAYGNTIKLLCDRVALLESQVATLQAQITIVQSTCCS